MINLQRLSFLASAGPSQYSGSHSRVSGRDSTSHSHRQSEYRARARHTQNIANIQHPGEESGAENVKKRKLFLVKVFMTVGGGHLCLREAL